MLRFRDIVLNNFSEYLGIFFTAVLLNKFWNKMSKIKVFAFFTIVFEKKLTKNILFNFL